MKTKLIILAFILMAFTTDSVLDQLNITTQQANESIFGAMSSGYLQFDKVLVDKARSMPVSVQVSSTRLLVKFIKEYTQSDAFASSYKKYRKEHMVGKSHGFRLPKPSDLVNKTVDKFLKGNASAAELPGDPQALVRNRLKEFLEVSSTVDFNAQLTGKTFTDPAYESKDQKWKMYYRAGKPVIEAARDEVKKWLQETGN
ncbi:hypothetical protein [Mucilaginibacter sp. L3T2-6]|uniref:hypothetical protein n=1 Tax=Mucilaginibacter sp. L3T2-6 TaxID=3062491 RepID=UPI002675074D|nr:hypothetical protein [Mucilaginibacter sp. L3T2-6]MDO3642884.1 hypothetical protein [Mucilaginibacter sp. L3T2-6]MDV6215209.1 hypothetical protein [Mucilaginibacter sp. L3T2-6]